MKDKKTRIELCCKLTITLKPHLRLKKMFIYCKNMIFELLDLVMSHFS